jgi:hypothetical protein
MTVMREAEEQREHHLGDRRNPACAYSPSAISAEPPSRSGANL